MTITAIVLDGFHKGHMVRTSGYLPTLKLLKPKTTTVDYCCGGDDIRTDSAEQIEYKACFHGVDQKVVLYSTDGKSEGILSMFNWESSFLPWNYNTHLKVGYHNEPILRDDDGTQMSEYDKGYRLGIEDGRIMEAKESRKHFSKAPAV